MLKVVYSSLGLLFTNPVYEVCDKFGNLKKYLPSFCEWSSRDVGKLGLGKPSL